MEQAKSSQERVKNYRSLNETDKLSLIFTQQRKLSELEKRVTAFECSHQTGDCILCQDKDLTISQLQQQVETLRKKLYGRSSERGNKDKEGEKGNKGKKGNPKGGANKRIRLPSDQFPDARIEECTLVDNIPPKCTDCTHTMTDSGMRETAERLEYQPAEIYILRTHRVKYHCKSCQSAPQTAFLPERLAPGSSLGDSFLIQACISKFYDLIPTCRFAKILGRGKAGVSHQLLLKAQSIMAFVLTSVYQAIKEEILNSMVVFADETIHRQLEENNGHWRWYLWAFCNKTSIYFEVHDTRAGDVSIKFLMESKIIFLVSDAYTGYQRTIREINEERRKKNLPLLQSSLCNDHSRRYFFYAQSHPFAKSALDAYGEIYEIEKKVQEVLNNPLHENVDNTVKALKLRQTANPLFNEIYDISCEILMDSPEKSLEAKAAKYFLNHFGGLTLYLKHIELPISNAPSERGIRDSVLLRKVALGNHSIEAANEGVIQLTVMCSCKMIQVNPNEYLGFNRTRYLSKQPLLTPYQFKKYKESLKINKSTDSS